MHSMNDQKRVLSLHEDLMRTSRLRRKNEIVICLPCNLECQMSGICYLTLIYNSIGKMIYKGNN